jgi:hypothetical protein
MNWLKTLRACWHLDSLPRVLSSEGYPIVQIGKFEFYYYFNSFENHEFVGAYIRHPDKSRFRIVSLTFTHGHLNNLYSNYEKSGKWNEALSQAYDLLEIANTKRQWEAHKAKELQQAEDEKLKEKFEALFI